MIKVKRLSDGKLFTNDMSEESKLTIIEIHFSTSYTQVIVQEEITNAKGETKFLHSDVICEPLNGRINPVDLMAVSDDELGIFI